MNNLIVGGLVVLLVMACGALSPSQQNAVTCQNNYNDCVDNYCASWTAEKERCEQQCMDTYNDCLVSGP